MSGASFQMLLAAGGGLGFNFRSSASATGAADPQTLAGMNFGAAASNRRLIVAFSWQGTATLTSLTIGGVAATVAVQVDNGLGNQAGIAIADVPTGTSGDVVGDFSNLVSNFAASLYSVTGLASATAVQTGTSTANPLAATWNIAANSIVVACEYAVTTASGASTWTNLTEDVDNAMSAGAHASSAGTLFTSAQTALAMTCSVTNLTREVGCFANFA